MRGMNGIGLAERMAEAHARMAEAHPADNPERPGLGDSVIFVTEAGERAALVIAAHGTLVVDLEVFESVSTMNYKVGSVTYEASGLRVGSWHWSKA